MGEDRERIRSDNRLTRRLKTRGDESIGFPVSMLFKL
jgi:hypothetical protein